MLCRSHDPTLAIWSDFVKKIPSSLLFGFLCPFCFFEVVRIFLCDQIFIYNLESNEDNHLEHIHGRKKLLPILADPQAADLFWCGLDKPGPLAEKQWRPVDQLRAVER